MFGFHINDGRFYYMAGLEDFIYGRCEDETLLKKRLVRMFELVRVGLCFHVR